MTVRKIKRGKRNVWIIDIAYDTPAGRKRIRKDASVQELRAARLEEAEMLTRIQSHGTPEPPALTPAAPPIGETLAAFWASTYEPLKLVGMKPATRLSYASVWSRRGTGLRDLLGHLPLTAVGSRAILGAAQAIRGRGRSPRPALILLKSILSFAVETEVLPDMPRWPRGLMGQPDKIPTGLTAEEVRLLLGAATGWMRTALVLSAYCGLRMSEVRAIRPCDVDLRAGVVYVRRAFSEDELGSTKSDAERAVPLGPEAAAQLAVAMVGLRPDALIVTQRNGRVMRRQNMLAAFKRLCRQVGIRTNATYHQTRHFFASTLAHAGTDLETLRDLTGHASLSSLERYLHTTDGAKRQAVSKIALGTGMALETR